MPSFEDIYHLKLKNLSQAVSDWTDTVTKLKTLANDADKGMLAKAKSADWAGRNATITKPFIEKTTKEFHDALIEATSIRNILRDAHDALKIERDNLNDLVNEARTQGLSVNSQGVIDVRLDESGEPTHIKGAQKKIDAMAKRIEEVLGRAAEVDTEAVWALHTLSEDPHNFSTTKYKSLKAAEQAKKVDAIAAGKEAVNLAQKSDQLTSTELAHLNKLLATHKHDQNFSETFTTGLGAKGALDFWHNTSDPDMEKGKDPKTLAHLQDNLSFTLATASHSKSPEMKDWKKEILELGDVRLKNGPSQTPTGPYGFQVMSNLMRKGEFDTAFLKSYGNEVLAFEKKASDPKSLWQNPGADHSILNFGDKKDYGNDPMTGFLEALGHNSEASTDFFKSKVDLDPDSYDDKPLSVYDYLVEDRDWPLDNNYESTGGEIAGYKALGHALESGTLGYPYDEKHPSIPPVNTTEEIAAREDRLDLMDKVMDHYKTSDVIDQQPGIRESLTRMAAGHIDSLNYSEANWGGAGKASGRDELFSADKLNLRDFGLTDSTHFLRALATDKDSYDALSTAQEVYGMSAMVAQGNDRGDALDLGVHSAKMHGLLDQVRAESIGKEFADDEAARNKQLEKQAEWRKYAAGTAIGTVAGVTAAVIAPPVGVATAIAVPLAFEHAQGATNTQFATETIDWLNSKEYNNDNEAIESIDEAMNKGAKITMSPLLAYAKENGMSEDEIRDLTTRAETGYNDGRNRSTSEPNRGWAG